MAKAKKIVFTGGGTVGHVTLNLILIPKFLKDGWEVHYIGDKHGIEHEQIDKSGLDVTFHSIATGKLRRYFSWQNMLDVFKVGWGILQSIAIIAKIRPQALFSKGGFVSVPPVIASKLLGVPVYVHESDLSMGLANKIAYKFATTMFTTFEQSKGLAKTKHVGAITKVGMATSNQSGALDKIKEQFDDNLKTVLFIGGHLYRVDYVTDLYQPLMDTADLVVTRGGSNTIFELLAMKKLHLIIPLGKEASRGDQLENAAYFERKGYARQLQETELSWETLNHELEQLVEHAETYKEAMAKSDEITSPDDFYNLLVTSISKK